MEWWVYSQTIKLKKKKTTFARWLYCLEISATRHEVAVSVAPSQFSLLSLRHAGVQQCSTLQYTCRVYQLYLSMLIRVCCVYSLDSCQVEIVVGKLVGWGQTHPFTSDGSYCASSEGSGPSAICWDALCRCRVVLVADGSVTVSARVDNVTQLACDKWVFVCIMKALHKLLCTVAVSSAFPELLT